MKSKIVIVGAGLGGCLAAHALTPAHEVTFIELGASVTDMQDRVFDVAKPAGIIPHIGAGLGGTTALWHNALIEIDEEIFTKYWPFAKSELAPWYQAAFPLLGGGEYQEMERLTGAVIDMYRKAGLVADFFQAQFIPSNRRNLWQSLGLRDRVKVIRGEAYRFRVDESRAVRSVLIKTAAGEREIPGDYFILAAGGLGTPALLQTLADEIPIPSLRNAGHFYEDHPQTFVGQVQISAPIYRFWNYSTAGGNLRVPAVVRHDGLHVSFQLRPAALRLREDRFVRMGSILTKVRNQMWNPLNWFRLLAYWDDILDIISLKFGIRIPTSHYSLFMQAEQPVSAKRSISGTFDKAGNRHHIERNWVLTPEYLASVRGAIDRFTTGMGSLCVSATILSDWADKLATAGHHSGTARMSRVPELGVCDEHARIYGLDNIYIADGSAIPGSGIANTGLTIGALALRLADHLQQEISTRPAPVRARMGASFSGSEVSTMPVDPAPARFLITGATGFIGSRLCERLKLGGVHQVRAFVRNANRAASLAGSNVELVTGDLLDPQSIAQALDGCDAVVHLAHGDDQEGPAATRNLIDAASHAGVRRFVHISSMAVHGPSPGPEAVRESTARIGRYDDEYCNSKAEQEEIVQQAMDRGVLRATILRPTVVYGPNGSFVRQVIAEAKTGTVTMFDEGAGLCNAVFVDDVCDAIEAAMVQDAALGKAMFIAADKAVTWGEFIRTFAGFIQPPPQVKNISSTEALAWWKAHPRQPMRRPGGLLSRVVRKAIRMISPKPKPAPFPVPGRVLRETVRVEFTNEEARRLLGWAPKRDFVAGVAQTRQWFDTGAC